MTSVLDTDHRNFFCSICCWVNDTCGLWANPQVHNLTASFLRMKPAPLISSPEVAYYPITNNSVFVFVYLTTVGALISPKPHLWLCELAAGGGIFPVLPQVKVLNFSLNSPSEERVRALTTQEQFPTPKRLSLWVSTSFPVSFFLALILAVIFPN